MPKRPETSKKPKGVHPASKKLANGERVTYHYTWKGGPRFWDSRSGVTIGSSAYLRAYERAKAEVEAAAKAPAEKLTSHVLRTYYENIAFMKLAPRTRADYKAFLDSFEDEFGQDPIKIFEDTEIQIELTEWKSRWSNSAKRHDYATTVVTRFLNFARKSGFINWHPHTGVQREYKSDRSDIIWLPHEIDAILKVANEREARIVTAATAGLTPQDLGRITDRDVQRTPLGRRILLRRKKTGKVQSIPATPDLERLIDTTPPGQTHLLVSLSGKRLTSGRASGIVRDLVNRANAAASRGEGHHVREELRLYDMRGTAATELLRAGCSLNEIAVSMGWGLRHAGNVIEKYAALVPEVSDEVLEKLKKARAKEAQDKLARKAREAS